MRHLIRTTLIAALLLGGGTYAGAQVSFGIRIGPPPPPRVVHVRPVQPGPDYVWIDGYWYPVNGHYIWHQGYWSRPPYEGARWIGPRRENGQFYEGYWEGDRGRVDHDHHWDRDRNRDYDRWHQDNDDRNRNNNNNNDDRNRDHDNH